MNKTVETLLADAAALVDAADIPEDLRTVAFSKAVDLLAETSAIAPTSSPPSTPESSTTESSGWMVALKTATERNLVELEEVFFANDDGEPLVGANPTHLGSNAAKRSRNAMLLLVGARQIGNVERTTKSELLREECRRLGILDSPNFSVTLSNLKDWFNITGSRKSKVVLLKPRGREAFRDLLANLLDDDLS